MSRVNNKTHKINYTIGGQVAEGFEEVRKAFEYNFQSGVEVSSQLCIYYQGVCVVDLYGTVTDDVTPGGLINDGNGNHLMATQKGYGAHSIQQVFSSTKNLSAIVVALLVDKGLLKYNEKVSTYWPEFAQHGKENITVADVLRHDSGLPQFSRQATQEDMEDQSIGGKLDQLIASSTPNWSTPHTSTTENPELKTLRRAYHGQARGLILQMIVQRVDRKHRTIGQILRDEIVIPLNLTNECFLGMPLDIQRSGKIHIADMLSKESGAREAFDEFRDTEKQKELQNLSEEQRLSVAKAIQDALAERKKNNNDPVWSRVDPDEETHSDLWSKHEKNGFMAIVRMGCSFSGIRNGEWSRLHEKPSENGHTNARSLGKIAAAMAGRGAFDGVQLMSTDAFAESHSNITHKFDDILLADSRFTQGGFAEFRLEQTAFNTKEGEGNIFGGANTFDLEGSFFGWGGAGGSVFIWSPEYDIGFAYTMTGMARYIVGGPRTKRIFSALCECINMIDIYESSMDKVDL